MSPVMSDRGYKNGVPYEMNPARLQNRSARGDLREFQRRFKRRTKLQSRWGTLSESKQGPIQFGN